MNRLLGSLLLCGFLFGSPPIDQGAIIIPPVSEDQPEFIIPPPRFETRIEVYPNALGGSTIVDPNSGRRVECNPSVLGGWTCRGE
jgi:hypothetical protein